MNTTLRVAIVLVTFAAWMGAVAAQDAAPAQDKPDGQAVPKAELPWTLDQVKTAMRKGRVVKVENNMTTGGGENPSTEVTYTRSECVSVDAKGLTAKITSYDANEVETASGTDTKTWAEFDALLKGLLDGVTDAPEDEQIDTGAGLLDCRTYWKETKAADGSDTVAHTRISLSKSHAGLIVCVLASSTSQKNPEKNYLFLSILQEFDPGQPADTSSGDGKDTGSRESSAKEGQDSKGGQPDASPTEYHQLPWTLEEYKAFVRKGVKFVYKNTVPTPRGDAVTIAEIEINTANKDGYSYMQVVKNAAGEVSSSTIMVAEWQAAYDEFKRAKDKAVATDEKLTVLGEPHDCLLYTESHEEGGKTLTSKIWLLKTKPGVFARTEVQKLFNGEVITVTGVLETLTVPDAGAAGK